jgi:hypothetical protein
MKRMMVWGLIMLALSAPVRAEGPTAVNRVFQPGEELRYKVKWKFLRLGTLTIRTLRDNACQGPGDFKIVMVVESNPDLGFIWIREWNESLMDAMALCSKTFRGKYRNGDAYVEIRQAYDQRQRTAIYTEIDGNSGAPLSTDTLLNADPYVEGPSLVFYARCVSRSIGVRRVPTLVRGKISATELWFDGSLEDVEISALDRPVRTKRYTGHAEWSGGSTAGVSGDFTGWVSDDDAAVPIVAEMKVLLGSIRLELEQWTRPAWAPPSGPSLAKQ